MGQGYVVKCRNCDYEECVRLGVGMMYPQEYADLVKGIKAGEYGDELREYFINNPGAVVDAQLELYYCPVCHNFEFEYNLSLYRHKQNKELVNGYWIREYDNNEDYVFVRAYKHICSKCGNQMHKIKKSEFDNLVCPKCGQPLEVTSQIMWD